MHGRTYEQLGEARRAAGLTQQQIADLLGISRSHVTNIENGVKGTTPEDVERWAAACGYEVKLVPVPVGTPDPEGLVALVSAIRDPAARQALATLARLTRKPPKYWYHFMSDFHDEELRAERDEVRKS